MTMERGECDCPQPPVFKLDGFLSYFPEFADEEKYARNIVIRVGMRAMMHICPSVFGMPLAGAYRDYAIFLMAAHMIYLSASGNDGDIGGAASGMAGAPFKAIVGSVTVESSRQNPYTLDDWTLWLGKTPYGQELLAYLDLHSQGGIFLNEPKDSVRDLL